MVTAGAMSGNRERVADDAGRGVMRVPQVRNDNHDKRRRLMPHGEGPDTLRFS